MGNMRSYRRAVARAKANKMSHYGKNGKSIKLFHMIWDGQQEAAGKGVLAKKKAQAKAKQQKNDNAISKALKKAKDALADRTSKKPTVAVARKNEKRTVAAARNQ